MSIRTRLAIIVTAVAALLGLGAQLQGATASPHTSNNGCVVVPPAKVAICVQRF